MDKQLFTILYRYLNKTGISVDKKRLKKLLQTHPEYNTLYSISDVLDELQIEHIVLRTDIDGLTSNGFPVIVHTKEDEGTFLFIENITADKVYFYKDGSGSGTESLDIFKEKWTGIALYISQNKLADDIQKLKKTDHEKILRLRIPLAILSGVVGFSIWGVATDWSIILVCLLSVNIIGLIFSILLILHDFGESYILFHKVCHLTRQTNCNAVLLSPAAKLLGWLSMSDIGLCYFSGSILALILAGVAQQLESTISWLLILTLCTFPYTLFSIWYQAFKVKKWCPLCLGVLCSLWVEMALFFVYRHQVFPFPITSRTIFLLFAGFISPVLIWMFIKPLLKEFYRIKEFEYRYLRLKNTPYVVRAAIENGAVHEMMFSKDEINLGTYEANLHITIVMSLFCQPCSNEWKYVKQLLDLYSDKVCFTIRFSGYHPESEYGTFIDSFIEVYLQNGKDAFCDALSFWFEHKNYENWKLRYSVKITDISKNISEKIAQWEKDIPITYTPTIFIGNRFLPTRYHLNDLKYLIEDE